MVHRKFVNVHRIQRPYGGPEEGGWWYDQDTYLYSIKTAVCVCYLPLAMLNIQLHRHEDNCGLHALVEQTRERYAGHRDEWIPQDPGNDSPERLGEVITASLSPRQGHNYPSRPPKFALNVSTIIPGLQPERLRSIPAWGIPGRGVGFPI